MKHVLFFMITLFSYNSSTAQEQYFEKQSIVKINPMSFSYGKLSLGYEYVLENNKSFAIQVGIPIGNGLTGNIEDNLQVNDVTFEDASISTFSVRPSYRMYLSSKKRGPKGIYFEPSAKYQTIKVEGSDGNYKDPDTGKTYDLKTENKVSMAGIGLQLGSQWIIGDAFVIDFFFFGPEYNIGSFNSRFYDDGLIPAEDRQQLVRDIEETYNDLPLIGTVRAVENDEFIEMKTSRTTIPGLRFGLQFGYSF